MTPCPLCRPRPRRPSARAIGLGLIILGAGLRHRQDRLAAVESIARQPESAGPIGTNMIIAAALVEGVTVIALIFALIV